MPDLAPPTPAVPLSELLAQTAPGLRQVAGPPAGEVLVQWVHASEMADPVPYLLGGELLLTAGVHFPVDEERAEYLDRYVARTVQGGAAALGFGLAPVHERTPGALVAACERHGLPLVEVAPRTPFAAVARAVWQVMARARERELRRVTEAQRALGAAAGRPDPVPAVLRHLAHHLGGRAWLLDAGGTRVHAAGAAVPAGVEAAARALAAVVRPGRAGAPASATDTAGGTRLAAYALAAGPAGGGSGGLVLVLAAERRDPADHAVAGLAAVLLSLLTGGYQGASDAGRTAALVRLLLGDPPERAVEALADGAASWTVVHAVRGAGGVRDGAAPGELAAALGTPLVAAGDGDGPLRALVAGDREITARPGWTFGVGAPAAAGDLAAADAQAAGALRRAVAGRVPVVRHAAPHSGIAALLAPAEAAAYARSRLAPIAGSPALIDTLRTWISLYGNWDRTAVALGVHRNTVRQRVSRAAALLEADLDDPDVRTDLWIALRYG
ncbi:MULTISPECIES: PucR family transcriptional regulator [Streptomycetaceae]|uniref:Regulatory protein n=1 Tax=Streptantibioticus cattleyicolor (strain ATCC 35852 / DSM 46488 / JCM 4925 / NBRC 14057 / NRRL 8057) TaxID=1003195 RepID=F8JSA1_STREN|nr:MULTISPECIES: PucR family transcriptional regulator [Streptomycetaceae]AEW94214.1 regulatory protein [Streptantibioticus cattleyicolor NRRL 8057 = DSM 46488]MYS58874.1 PucR family transcriptional regulator [Streptomyces sp. SID5468]CCB74569.1 putative regulatory protein [Streptantibioticus cattleyicolor NRRL 8057 = DSM 46488]